MQYRWKKKDRLWRRAWLREAARRCRQPGSGGRLRRVLLGALALELVTIAGRYGTQTGIHMELARTEEDCHVEWVVPEEDDRQTPEEDCYGIRFQPETLELQFYHRKQNTIQN